MAENSETICVNKQLLKEYVINYGDHKFKEGFTIGFIEGLLLGASFTAMAFLVVKQK